MVVGGSAWRILLDDPRQRYRFGSNFGHRSGPTVLDKAQGL